MEATGIVRRIDELGRVTIPKAIRDRMRVHEGDAIEYFLENNSLIIKAYEPGDPLTYEEIEPVWKEMSENARYDLLQRLYKNLHD